MGKSVSMMKDIRFVMRTSSILFIPCHGKLAGLLSERSPGRLDHHQKNSSWVRTAGEASDALAGRFTIF
jgi:hypothetical protein